MRALFIVVGIGLIRRFHWITYLFGALLVYSGIKLFCQQGAGIEPDNNPVVRLFRRWVPVTEDYAEDKFVVRRERLYATPLLTGIGAGRSHGFALCHRFNSCGVGHNPESTYVFTRPTCLRFWACARCTSCWPA